MKRDTRRTNGCTDRTRNWVLGRSKLSKDGKLVPKCAAISEVVQKTKQLTHKQQKGEFKPKRQNDQLTAALGSKDHAGRTRAISPMAPWNLGFPDDVSSYKKRDPPPTQDKVARHEEWQEHFWQFMRDNPEIAKPFEIPPIPCLDVNNVAIQDNVTNVDPPAHDEVIYPIDKIIEDTPCTLNLIKGRTGRIVPVALGTAMVGCTFHNRPIPVELAMVHSIKLTKDKYKYEDLDYPIPEEGIETLGDAVNNFILWQ